MLRLWSEDSTVKNITLSIIGLIQRLLDLFFRDCTAIEDPGPLAVRPNVLHSQPQLMDLIHVFIFILMHINLL